MEYETSNNINKKENIDDIQITIQQLVDSNKPLLPSNDHDSDDDRQILSNLISQLDAIKVNGVTNPSEPYLESEVASCTAEETETKGEDKTTAETEELVKEVKKLRGQNKTTHWLLSALILLTVAWQLSEVSLLLNLKQSVTQPFQSVGNVFKGMFNFKRPRSDKDEQTLFGAENRNDSLLNLSELVANGEKE